MCACRCVSATRSEISSASTAGFGSTPRASAIREGSESAVKPRSFPFAFPTCSVVQVTQNNNGPLGPSFVHELNALEEQQDYDRAAREEGPERDGSLTCRRAVLDEQSDRDEAGRQRREEQRGDNGPSQCSAKQQCQLDVAHPETGRIRDLHHQEEGRGA